MVLKNTWEFSMPKISLKTYQTFFGYSYRKPIRKHRLSSEYIEMNLGRLYNEGLYWTG
jgi:hypothetical protein